MRKICMAAAFFVCNMTVSSAQFYKSFLPSPAFSDSLQKIVSSFQHNYYSIQGDALGNKEDVDTYEARVSVPGAEKTVLYRFHSLEDTTASWQAVMYSGESYKEAARIYRNTFRYINKAHLSENGQSISFSGAMEEPTESLRFTSSVLKAVSANIAYKHFVAEVEMVNSFTGWEVHFNLHNKRDDRDKY